MAKIPATERVWRRVQVGSPDECWLWTGARPSRRHRSGGAYGHMGGDDRRTVYVHRVAYESRVGPIPEGFEVDHLCGQTLCCNPTHLQAVPPRENNLRSSSYAAANAAKECCPRGHPYDEANTGYRRPTAGKGSPNARPWRYCRACAREAQRARRLGIDYPTWRTNQDA